MNSYKGFSYPTVREFFAEEEKYTNPNNENQWSYVMGGINILIDKDKGNKEVDEIFKHFIDEVYEDSKKINGAVQDMVNTVNQRNKKVIDEAIQKKSKETAAKLNIDLEKVLNAQSENSNLSDEELNKIAKTFNGEEIEVNNTSSPVVGIDINNSEEQSDEIHMDDLEYDELQDDESFEDLVKRLDSKEIDFSSDKDFTIDEISDYVNDMHPNTLVISQVLNNDSPLSDDEIKSILKIANKRKNKETFNVYKELPDRIKEMIELYIKKAAGYNDHSTEMNTMRNKTAEALIDDFIANIQFDRLQTDFGKEVESIFTKNSSEVSELIVGYSKEKIESYYKALETMEDEEKKERLKEILDNIEDAYSLNSLKEFAKTCKVKKIELEKPNRVFDSFTYKYSNSTYDAFSIDMIRTALTERLKEDTNNTYTDNDVTAFFIAFCKQTMNYKSSKIVHHAYMYFVTYNIALININVSEKTKSVSDEFIENIKEVIANLRERNKGVL